MTSNTNPSVFIFVTVNSLPSAHECDVSCLALYLCVKESATMRNGYRSTFSHKTIQNISVFCLFCFLTPFRKKSTRVEDLASRLKSQLIRI